MSDQEGRIGQERRKNKAEKSNPVEDFKNEWLLRVLAPLDAMRVADEQGILAILGDNEIPEDNKELFSFALSHINDFITDPSKFYADESEVDTAGFADTAGEVSQLTHWPEQSGSYTFGVRITTRTLKQPSGRNAVARGLAFLINERHRGGVIPRFRYLISYDIDQPEPFEYSVRLINPGRSKKRINVSRISDFPKYNDESISVFNRFFHYLGNIGTRPHPPKRGQRR